MEKIENESENNITTDKITVSIPKLLSRRLEVYIKAQDIPPYRSQIFVKALEEFLDKREGE